MISSGTISSLFTADDQEASTDILPGRSNGRWARHPPLQDFLIVG